jgi:RNA polymerase sigma-70 factor, ECF subfamily
VILTSTSVSIRVRHRIRPPPRGSLVTQQTLGNHGRRQDFEEIYARDFGLVRAWLARHSGRDADADDLANEVFTSAYRGWDTYRGAASRRSWLFAIARNTVRNWRRKRAADVLVSPAAVREAVAEPAEAVAVRRAALDDLLGRIASEQGRRAVVLRYVLGCSVDEVAAELGTTPSAVTSLTHRTLQGLRTRLGDRP